MKLKLGTLMPKIPEQWESWDTLRTWGNNRLVQFTIVIPVVGYVILFSTELSQYFQLLIDPETNFSLNAETVSYRLYFLYLGFCSLALGSLIYSFRCPAIIKTHGSAYDFIQKQSPIMHKERMNGMRSALGREIAEWEPHEVAAIAESLQTARIKSLEADMRDYFELREETEPKSRHAVFLLYSGGSALLAFPTLYTFYRVIVSLVQKLAGAFS